MDIDRVFIDIMAPDHYIQLVDDRNKKILSTEMKKIKFNAIEFNVVIRPHTVQFLKELKKYFNIFIVTWWQKELVTKVLPLIDPDGTVFPLKSIISLKHNELKSIEYVLN